MHLSPQARGWSLSSGKVGVAVPEDLVREVGVVLGIVATAGDEREVAGEMEGRWLSLEAPPTFKLSRGVRASALLRFWSDWTGVAVEGEPPMTEEAGKESVQVQGGVEASPQGEEEVGGRPQEGEGVELQRLRLWWYRQLKW